MTPTRVTRRRFCALSAGVVSVAAVAAGGAAGSPGVRLKVRGTHLYVEDSGPREAPALLYLHGGPGTGGYDFSLYQRQRLSAALRLIVIDERGVLRSDPIATGQPFGFADLVEDCEALRQALHLERWAVVGHSFGGYLALAYALKYPRTLTRVVFENPTFDFNTTGRYLLRLEAQEFARLGKSAEAEEAVRVADLPPQAPTTEVWDGFGRATNQLGKTKDDLYVHGTRKQFFDELVAQSGLSSEEWRRGMTQQRLLYREGKVFEPLTARLAELSMPALLIKGRYDPVTPPDQVDAFLKHAPAAGMRVFENSSHFVHVEEPDAFADTVTAFVVSGAMPDQATAARWQGVPPSRSLAQ